MESRGAELVTVGGTDVFEFVFGFAFVVVGGITVVGGIEMVDVGDDDASGAEVVGTVVFVIVFGIENSEFVVEVCYKLRNVEN